MPKWILPAATAVVLTAIVASAFAQSPAAPPAPRPGAGSFLQHARQALNLTDEQVARLERTFAAHHERTARVHINLTRARLDLREALLAPTPERARVEEIARRMAALQGELALARVNLQLELRGILTLEQYQRFQRLLRIRMERLRRGRR